MSFEERILWDDVEGEAVTTIYGLLMCWSLADYKITFKEHCKDRVKQRHISYDEILDTLQHGKLIEVHFLGNRCTILLRKQRHNKAEDLSIKKLTSGNPTMQQMFEDLKKEEKEESE